MAIKFWRIKLKGVRSPDEIHSAIGRFGGHVIRIHSERGETHVYFAAEQSAAPDVGKAMKEAAPPEEVSASDVTKIG